MSNENPFAEQGAKLRAWLERSNTTQTRLCEMTDIPQAVMSKYVAGKQRPQLDNAVRIERATNGGVPADTWASCPGEPLTYDEQREAFDALSLTERAELLALAKAKKVA